MPDPVTAAPVDDPGGRYPSLKDLRDEHLRLVRSFKTEKTLSPEQHDALLDEVAEFVRRGRATGAVLGASEDRHTAQGLLTYWSNALYRAGRPGADTDTDLVEFNVRAAPNLDGVPNPFDDIGRWADDAPPAGWARLVDDVAEAVGEHRLVAVLGANGSGRHTLIHNGLIPALRAGRLAGSGDWDYLPQVVLGPDPLAALTAALTPPAPAPAGEATISSIVGALRPTGDRVAAVAALAAARPKPAVLVVERFGEIMATTDLADVQKFADALLAVVDAAPGHRVVLTVNPARLGPVEKLGAFGRRFRQGQVLVGFSAAELRQMVTDPADRVGLRFNEGVLDRLLMDVQGDPAGLALLRFSLRLLWDARKGNQVTHEVYDHHGGGRLAVGRRAEEVFATLDPPGSVPEHLGPHQTAARDLLLRLIRPTTGTGVVCGRVSRGRLVEGLPPEAAVVLKRFEDEGLIVPVTRVAGEPPEVAPVHEALATGWPRFLEWLDVEREKQQWRLRLRSAAEQWQAGGRKTGALWAGVALKVARSEAERVTAMNPFSTLELDFLAASVRRDRWVRGVVICASAAAILAVLSYYQARVAVSDANAAVIASAAEAEKEKNEAARVAQEKLDKERAAALREAERTNAVWQLHAGTSDAPADLPGSYLRFAYAWESEVKAAQPQPVDAERAFGHQFRLGTIRHQVPALRGMAYQPDGVVPTVAAQAPDGRVAVTAGVKQVKQMPPEFALVVTVWRSGADGQFQPKEIIPRPFTQLGAPKLPSGPPTRVGGVFVGGGGSAVVMLSWDKQGGVVCPFEIPDGGEAKWLKTGSYDGYLGKAELSPDGRHFAVASYQFDDVGTTASSWLQWFPEKAARVTRSAVTLWATPAWEAVPLPGTAAHDGRVGFLAFDAGTKRPRLAAAFGIDSHANTPVALEWEIGEVAGTGKVEEPKAFSNPNAARTDQNDEEALVAAYTPGDDPALFVSRSSPRPRTAGTHTTWLYPTDGKAPLPVMLPPGPDSVTAVAFSPVSNPVEPGGASTARAFALGTAGGAVSFWRLEQPDGKTKPWSVRAESPAYGAPARGSGHTQQVFRVRFSPDGQYVVSASRDRRALLWAAPGRLLNVIPYHSGSVTDAAFTPDGRGLLTVAGTAAYRWDLPAAGSYPVSFTVPGVDLDRSVRDTALSASGNAFAAGGERRGYPNAPPAVGFDRTAGQTGGRRGWARAWKTTDGTPLTPELLTPEPVVQVAVSKGEPHLVCTTEADGTVRLWDKDGGQLWTERDDAHKATFAAFGGDGTALRLVVVGRANKDVAAGTTQLRAYHLGATGATVRELKRASHPDPLTAAVFGPRGDRVAAYAGDDGDGRGLAVVWDLGEAEPRPLNHAGRPAHRDPVTHVGFGADGTRVVTAGRDDEVVVWSSPEKGWKAEVLGVVPGTERVGHKADVLCAAFDTSGDRVVSGGRDGNTIVWVKEDGRYQLKLTLRPGEPSREVVQAVFADDQLVATAAGDNVVRVWDTKAKSSSGRLVASATFPMTVRHVRWRSDPGGGGAVSGVGPAADFWSVSNRARPWAARFTAATFPLARLTQPPADLVKGAEVVAARTAVNKDPVQLVTLPSGEAFRHVPSVALPHLSDPRAWHRWEAVLCEASGNLAGARWHLDALLDPKNPPAAGRPDLLGHRARVLAQVGEWDLAEDDYKAALVGHEGEPDVLRPLAQLKYQRAGREADPEKRKALFGKAAAAYRDLSRRGRGDPHDGLRLADSHLEASDLAAAIEVCDLILKGKDGGRPDDLTGVLRSEVLVLRAEAHSKSKQPALGFADYAEAGREFHKADLLTNAANAFGRALALKEQAAPGKQELGRFHAGYGDVLIKQGMTGLNRDQKAETHFRAATTADPGVAEYWHKLGLAVEADALRVTGAPRGRAALLRDALEAFTAEGKHPDSAPLLAGRVRVLTALGKWDEALADSKRLLVLEPAVAAHRYSHGDLLLLRRDWAEADMAYRAAADLVPPTPNVRIRVAAAAARAGRLEDAAKTLSEIADTPGSRVTALSTMARVHLRRGDLAGYHKACDRLFELEQKAPADFTTSARNTTAWAVALSGDHPQPRLKAALELSRRAVEAVPQSATYRNTLAAVQVRNGESDKAYKALKQLVDDWEDRQDRTLTLAERYNKAADHLFLALASRATNQAEEAVAELKKARDEIGLFDRALNMTPGRSEAPGEGWTPDAIASSVWHSTELGLLLAEVERPPGRKD
ncbi:MAG TPA: hypothetical protein VD866_27485 [Urbifossiella sp.]|nr:hypothetical protein [Urbifossiella sp.]